MFAIFPTILLPSCFKLSSEYNAPLWHCRYGHLGQKGLITLAKKGMVRELPKLCQYGEMYAI